MLDIGKHHKRGKQWTTLKEIKKRQEYHMMSGDESSTSICHQIYM